MVSYVLLVSIVLTLSIIVGSWIYFQSKNPPLGSEICDGVSVTADGMDCVASPGSKILLFDIVNTGRFTVHKVLVRVDIIKGDIVRTSLDPFIPPIPPPPDKPGIKPGESGAYSGEYGNVYQGKIKVMQLTPVVEGALCSSQAVIFDLPVQCS